jgi:hypothetical protein
MNQRSLWRRWALVVAIIALMAGAAAALAAPVPATTLFAPGGTGYDPLTESETVRALTALGKAGALPSLGAGVDGIVSAAASAAPPVEQVLLVERREELKAAYAGGSAHRRADVYIYHYPDNKLVRTTYNLESGVIDSREELADYQLPLVEEEVARAAAALVADPVTWATLSAEYQTITGHTLLSVEQLDIKAMTFDYRNQPTEELRPAALCGVHRCAQLLLATWDNVSLSPFPIIDLSAGHVVAVLNFNPISR